MSDDEYGESGFDEFDEENEASRLIIVTVV